MNCCFKANEKDLYKTYTQLTRALHDEGLESSQIILAYDFSASNQDTGLKSYNYCMHDINTLKETPYQKVTKMMEFLIKEFDEDGKIPCYVFGDVDTKDIKVKPLQLNTQDEYITGMDNIIAAYQDACKRTTLDGPTTMGPVIRKAIQLCQESKQYHILIIMTDGGISSPELDAQAVIDASNYPLSIITVGLGDGPFDVLEKFDNKLKKRKFDNFNFFNFTEMEKKLGHTENVDEAIAVEMLQEIPAQYADIVKLGYL
ncbi:Copine_I [Hexamita inflata]|uniref:Copine I n=1 Tax=Hexamita inflata TaxID=28002 RepID=A0AA86R3G4_9EUKA|nr:Copine I [Hexamita inflata]